MKIETSKRERRKKLPDRKKQHGYENMTKYLLVFAQNAGHGRVNLGWNRILRCLLIIWLVFVVKSGVSLKRAGVFILILETHIVVNLQEIKNIYQTQCTMVKKHLNIEIEQNK